VHAGVDIYGGFSNKNFKKSIFLFKLDFFNLNLIYFHKKLFQL